MMTCGRGHKLPKTKAHDLPVPTEEDEQTALFQWAEWESGVHPELRLMFHVPNEGKRSMVQAAIMRRMGLKAGVPDICLPVPRGHYHGMFIEMKRQKGGNLGDNQKAWLDALTGQGYYCVICKGWEIAVKEIKAYLSEQV